MDRHRRGRRARPERRYLRPTFTGNDGSPYAGVGVTPLLAMLHGAVARDAVTPRQVRWLHSARDRAHHSFAQEANDLLTALSASHRCVVYSRPAPGDIVGRDFDQPGSASLTSR